MTQSSLPHIHTARANILSRRFSDAGLGTRLLLVEYLPVVTIICGPSVELPVIFHDNEAPGLLFVPYRADSLMSVVDSVLEASGIPVRRINIREDEFARVMEAVFTGYHELLAELVGRCQREDDMDNIAD